MESWILTLFERLVVGSFAGDNAGFEGADCRRGVLDPSSGLLPHDGGRRSREGATISSDE